MLSSVLRSPRAIAVNVEIMRVFVTLREAMASHARLAHKLNELEQRYDAQFKVVFDPIRAQCGIRLSNLMPSDIVIS